MRKFIGAVCAVSAFTFPSFAHAEDAWDGAYVGVYAGMNASTVDARDNWCWMICDGPPLSKTSAAFGATIGANKQVSDALVVGIEGDIGTGSATRYRLDSAPNGAIPNLAWDSKIRTHSTVRMRAGLASGRTMAFVTGGLALADLDVSATSGPTNYKDGTPGMRWGNHWKGVSAGYAYGAGVEQLVGSTSVKFEFLRSSFGTKTTCYKDLEGPTVNQCWSSIRAASGVRYTPSITTIRLGANFHF